MPLRVPPPEIPVISWLTPNKTDQGLLEFWNTEVASYTPLDIGAAHPNSRQYPNFKLGKQTPVQGDEKWTLRIWVTDETNPDWFNWAGKFAGEDNAFPIFIRTYREPRNSYTPRVKGTPLKTLYKLVLTENGSGYSNGVLPNVVFDTPLVAPTEDAIAHGVVAPDGTISEAVLDFGGEGYAQDVHFSVDAPINGSPAEGIAYVQPQTVILTREEAALYPEDSPFYAQYLQVVRVYETIPGPTFNETRLDVDGGIINVSTTRKLCSDITTGEDIDAGTWCKTTSKPTDIDVICEEVVECRTVPGNDMISTKIDNDGMVLTRTQTLIDNTTAVSEETITLGVWTKKYIEEKDGSDLVEWQIVEERDVPGNPMVDIKIDKDGIARDTVKTLKDTTTIVQGEVVSGGGIWITTEKEAVSDLVAWEVVTARTVTASNPVLSYSIDGDHEIVFQQELLKKRVNITPSATEAGGNITTVEAVAVSDLVANEVTKVVTFLDKAVYRVEIPESIIPIEFRASIPTVTESNILADTASMPTLVGNDFMRQETQLTKLLMERRVQSLGDVDFPIETIGHVTSSEYGGAVLDVVRKLDDAELFAEEGEDIVSSEVKPIGDNLMWFRETSKRPASDAAWPIVPSRLWDENMRLEYDETFQWLLTNTPEESNPGVFGWVSEVKGKDKWHAQRVNTSKSTPAYTDEASALITYLFQPYKFPGLVSFESALAEANLFGYRAANAVLTQHTVRTWWVSSPTTPTAGPVGSGSDVEFSEIITGSITVLTGVAAGTYHDVLHDDYSFFASLDGRFVSVSPSTIPSFSLYYYGEDPIHECVFTTGSPASLCGLPGNEINVVGTGTNFDSFYTVYTCSGGNDSNQFLGYPILSVGGDTTMSIWLPDPLTLITDPLTIPVFVIDGDTRWIGSEKVVAATITPEREKDVWRIQTRTVTMQ